MTWPLALIGFSIPPWIARIYFRKDLSTLGLFQDLFVGAQLGALALISPWLIPPFQLLILYDGLIDNKLHFRLDGSCLPLLPQIGDFKDSAKALKIFKIFPLFFLLSFLPFIVPPLSFKFLILGLPFLYFNTNLGKDSLLILWEKQVLAIFYKPFKEKKKNFLPFVKKEIISLQEVYTSKSPSYPLFRYTHGFKGKKVMDIEITSEEKPHVMFLFIESLRAKDVGCLGGKYGATKNLDALTKESHLFTNFHSNSLLTFRSFYTSLFGLPYTLEMKTMLSKDIPTYGLPNHLKELGYETNFFTGAHWGVGGIGPFLKKVGADRVYDRKEIIKFNSLATGGSWGIDDEHLLEMTLDHFEKHQKIPQFYSVLTITSHHPWISPSGYVSPEFKGVEEGYYKNYLKTLHYADHQVGNFIANLKEKNLTKNLLLFVTGDHGLFFGKNNQGYEYQKGNQKDNFHVPLMIYADGRIKDAKVIDTLASQCDLLPTMMDLLNMKGYQHSIGRSLLREEKSPRIFFHNPSNLAGAICCKQEESVVEYDHINDRVIGDEKGLYPIIKNFHELFTAIYKKNLTVPPNIKNSSKNLRIEPYKPPHEISAEKLSEMIYSNSPMTSLILDRNNNVGEELLSKIADWSPDLDLLSIKDSYSVTDRGLSKLLNKCVNIYDLDISNCPLLTEKCLDSLPETIMRLHLKGQDFVNDIDFTRKLKHVEILDICHTPLTDRGFRRFPELIPNLSTLYFSYTNMTMDTILQTLIRIPLFRLFMQDCENLTNEEALKLLSPHPTIRFVYLLKCHKLTDEVFSQIKELNIRHLLLVDIPQLTNQGLEALLKLSLDSLHINIAPNLTADAFPIIDKYAHKFVDLDIKILNL